MSVNLATGPDAAITEAPASLAGDPAATVGAGQLASLVTDLLGRGLSGVFERMAWAEQEIEKAQARHPMQADRIFHSFILLNPSGHECMATEFVFRSHCAELLDRVAADTDTRPGTAAEVCCVMYTTSQAAPLTSTAAGLYMRMWQLAGFPELIEFTEASRHHEGLERSGIDEHEHYARHKLAVAQRRLGDIDCSGRHHGQEVACAYGPSRLAHDL